MIESPCFQSASAYGPVPFAVVLRSVVSPSFSTRPARPVRFHSSVESGSLSVSTMSWPLAAIDETRARRSESRYDALSFTCCSDHTTSAGVSGSPLWNVTPSRSVNV